MLSKMDRVEQLAKDIATDLFISMLNPIFRGNRFDHREFDIERHVDSMIGIHLPWEITDKQREHARTCARRIWNQWLKRAGVGIPTFADAI